MLKSSKVVRLANPLSSPLKSSKVVRLAGRLANFSTLPPSDVAQRAKSETYQLLNFLTFQLINFSPVRRSSTSEVGNSSTHQLFNSSTPQPINPKPHHLLTAAALLAYLPFLLSTAYLFPLGTHEWDYISNWGTENSFWYWQQYWYTEHGGRYASTAFLSTLPYWYSLPAFRLVAFADLLLLPVCTFVLIRTITDRRVALSLTSLVFLLYLHQLTNPFDSLLRFTCMPIYHGGYMAVALAITGLWRYSRSGSHTPLYLALLPAIYAIGSNEISLLHLLIGVGVLTAMALPNRRKPLYTVLALLLILAAIALLAPGNFNRADAYESDLSFASTAGLSVATSIFLWGRWLSDSLLLPGLLLAATFGLVFPNQLPKLHHPKLWLLALASITPLSLFPLLWGTAGQSLAERIVDLLFLVNTLLAFGWLFAWLSPKPVPTAQAWQKPLLYLLSSFIVLHTFADGIHINREHRKQVSSRLELIELDANVGNAWMQLLDGTAQGYKREQSAILEQVKNCKTDTCRAPLLQHTDFIGYDPLYDRLNRSGGEPLMGKALNNKQVKTVYYLRDSSNNAPSKY